MLPYAFLSLSLMLMRQAPAGTQLHVRLTTPVGTYASKVGSPVSAELIEPVTAATGEILLPAGSILQGSVKRVERVGFGVIHETASLEVEFREAIPPGGKPIPIETRTGEVENSREHVGEDGMIRGVRTTGSISYRASGYIRRALCWEIHARIALWAVRTLVLNVPEPEIYYAPGVEMTLWLTQPVDAVALPQPKEALNEGQRDTLEEDLQGLPYRTYTAHNKSSDLLNMVFIGTREEIGAAFAAAGWTEAKRATWRTRVIGATAVVLDRGYVSAPMSKQFVNDVAPEMLLQKALNDVSKRHHIRIWPQFYLPDGRQVWAGAATRDVDFAYLRPGQAITHRIEEDIDHERDKIIRDLAYTHCATNIDFWERPGAPLHASNSTGDRMVTDGRIAVLRMNSCKSPHAVATAEPLPVHGSYFQRLARREVLSIRSDFYRDNTLWRSYEGARWMVLAVRHRHSRPQEFRPEGGNIVTRVKNSSWLR
jgi:hypothetical protein